ncbi:hypothetical protein M427DRAFT_33942 [Gonapodya prolifera JEL478]|uniref:Uncharacterized protein n=1 Tax=Gonapodya prolifera (strain JEL478) TaxID=1344416 RepID=A0A139A963_GONPJ|nr:hypothetical protein M427DRAFT_33942 [Gonapodya prolifera JEL478]|eukprot:KXS13340.1 hypothetical protein M427DRAFT_33942 [Gonapodya prolifera JEL478]
MAQGRGPKTPSIHQEEWAKFENDIFKRAKDHLRCVGGGGNLDRDGLRKAQVECQKCGKKPTLRAALGLGAVDNSVAVGSGRPDGPSGRVELWPGPRLARNILDPSRAGPKGVWPDPTGRRVRHLTGPVAAITF